MTPPKLKNILVMGATGDQGGAVIKYLSKQHGHIILGVSRDPFSEAAKRVEQTPGVMVVFGDAADARSLFLHGPVDGVFLMLHSATPDELAHTKSIADAAVKFGAKYIVYSGVDLSGVDRTGIDGFDIKRDAWDYIKTLPIPATYLGPAGFMETLTWPGFAAYTQDWDAAYVHKYVCTDDIGHVAADCLADPERYAGREIMLAGDAVSRGDVKAAVEERTGRPLASAGGIDHAFARHLFEQLHKHPFEADPGALRKEFPYLHDLRSWLQTVDKDKIAPAAAGAGAAAPAGAAK
ncbi:hypothetical protein Q8F55_000255 [Vanrija albida]|uniref:NmrA-like domain-containing protein n=1 Tax=Vanrija albida TaxID=181172 RepID=A0ABR3QCR4_9TREE